MSAAEAVRALVDLAAAPHPDAALILACDRLSALKDEQGEIHRRRGRGHAARLHAFGAAHMAEMDRLYVHIAGMRPRTMSGHRARAELALREIGSGGICGRFNHSAIRGLLDAAVGEGA